MGVFPMWKSRRLPWATRLPTCAVSRLSTRRRTWSGLAKCASKWATRAALHLHLVIFSEAFEQSVAKSVTGTNMEIVIYILLGLTSVVGLAFVVERAIALQWRKVVPTEIETAVQS